jgi:GMP synthase (glutamine-hydrolysing)
MMAILVLRHEPFEHLGYFADILESQHTPFTYKDLGEPLSLDGFAAVIVMGGPQSANDATAELAGELRLLQQAIGEGKPVLGICLGAQLIAKALGAKVYRNPEKEIGWEEVSFTAAANGDPVLGGISSPSMFFHWHGETFDLPAGAEWLAFSAKCRHQAFRYGTNVYGIQFHPEITPQMIEDWTLQPANCGDVAEFSEPMDAHAFDTAGLARHVLDGWLSTWG